MLRQWNIGWNEKKTKTNKKRNIGWNGKVWAEERSQLVIRAWTSNIKVQMKKKKNASQKDTSEEEWLSLIR